jgi:hypothetical protein
VPALGLPSRCENVLADMVLHHFAHKAVHGTAGRRNELQDVGTADFLVEGALDRFYLVRCI